MTQENPMTNNVNYPHMHLVNFRNEWYKRTERDTVELYLQSLCH